MKQWMAVTMAGVLTCGLLVGCRGKSQDDKTACEECVAPEVAALDQLRSEIDDLKLESGRDAAIERMNALIADPEKAEFKGSLVAWLLDEYLSEDPIDTVQDLYLTLAADDEDFARMGFGRMLQASTSTNTADVIAWHEKILAAPVSDDMKTYVWQLRTRAYADAGSIAPLADRLRDILKLSAPEQSRSVIASIAKLGLDKKDYTGLAALCAAVKRSCPDREDLMLLTLTVEVDVLQQQGKLAEVEAFLSTHADALGDAAVASRAESLLVAAAKAGKMALAERVVSTAAAGGGDRPKTRDAVMIRWIRIAEDGQDQAVFVNRAAAALDAGCSAARVCSSFSAGFYKVMMSRDSAIQTRCLEVAERIAMADSLSESQRQALALLQLDGAFYAEDFKRAYAIVEGGIPGHDEEWHTEMKDKVGAHLALQEGRPEDAIALFKKHMARVASWEAPVVNPENGAKMTREAVLGFNEKRLGDIYAGMDGRSADAKAAYARAREWYQKALADLEPDSIEFKSATAELAQVPATE